jgi:hypothetical protein
MAKTRYQQDPRVSQIFEDLEKFLEFCQEYGYRYNEADLYNFRSYAWQQYNKFSQGKNARNMWVQDAAKVR